MSSEYRICHNCGASLTANEAYCPRCGAQFVEPIVQQPGEFEPFPPEQPSASEPTEPHAAQPQQPVILPPPPQSQASYPPQGQGYTPPPSTPASYGQQMPVTPGQVGGPPQPPTSDTDNRLRMNLIIGLIVVVVILLLAIGGFFIFSNQKNNPSPATTPTPGVIPTPTPTPTPGTTPTPTPTSVPFQVTTIDMSVNPLTIAGMSCGTQLTVTYTATFNVLPKGPGGAVQFTYTTDGGRTTKTGLVQFNPGQTSKQFQFTSSGTLALNGAFPGSGQVTMTSPNVVSSQTAIPSGSCTPVPSATP
jgi:zinc-ribbon domain